MNQIAATPTGLGRRSGTLAVVLTFFLPVAGFAYVRRLRWGVGFFLSIAALMFAAGRTGLLATAAGYCVLLGTLLAIRLAAPALAFRFARALPADTQPRWYNRWYHYVWLALLGALASNLMMTHRGALFGFEPFRVASTNMQPMVAAGDFITVDMRSSTMATIERGDIVSYVPRKHPDQTWIARVVGLPGETIVAKDHVVEIGSLRLPESYIGASYPADGYAVPFERTILGPGEYFLMGDNRPHAEDSRFQGPVARAALRGKVRAIWFSYSPFTHSIDTSRIGTLPAAYGK